jgi:death-on-curing protein
MTAVRRRLAWTACRTFLAINSQWISAPEDDRFNFGIRVAEGPEDSLDDVADQLRAWSHE